METSKPKECSFGLSYPMLKKINYIAWVMKMNVFMQAHGVWEAIDTKDPKGTVEDKIDKQALAVIYQGVPEDVLFSLSARKTSKQAWDAVKTMLIGAGKAFGEKMEEVYVVKKLLIVVPIRFLQIASTIEQFGNLEEMSVEEVVGSLKAHEERVEGVTETSKGQLLLREEKWRKKENSEGQVLLPRDEWLRRTSKERGQTSNMRVRGDKSKVSSFNCQAYGNFASECRKPRRDREEQKEENLTLIQEDEPVLLIAEVRQTEIASMLLKGKSVVPKLRTSNDERRESHIWYLDNGTSNHMTGARGKFKDLDERVTGKGAAVRHSTYILNRFPTHALSGKTPYEVWYGKKPDLSHVKNIRSVAFMKVPSVHMKLDDRGKMVKF
ncbi:uncharacterized protein LOC141686386 [Apium graveolens]|uniref:uncharacterized protein LOC141686386 n=1 Tax=Apium graveolens TaxID=4045 RepID=UPI003D78E895